MIFDGRKFQEERKRVLKKRLAALEVEEKRSLSLASFYFTEDKPSRVYTRLKEQTAQELGIQFRKYGLKVGSEADLEQVERLLTLESGKVDGVMIQKPKSIPALTHPLSRDEVFYRLTSKIPLNKDVDVISPLALGRLVMMNKPLEVLWPATVRSVFWILTQGLGVYEKGVDSPFELVMKTGALLNRTVVVVGNRGMVGSTLSLALSSSGAKVIGGDRGVNVQKLVAEGEVIISATGVPMLIKEKWLRPTQIIIDVGFGVEEGRVVGDFESAAYGKVKFAAPVPGGVGPVTVVSLMENLFQLAVKG